MKTFIHSIENRKFDSYSQVHLNSFKFFIEQKITIIMQKHMQIYS